MTTILYPTRGGASSYENQDCIIALAKERKANLIFLYVSNVEFLSSVARPALVDIVEDELEHMGEFLLAMAQERAINAGWQADALVRRGNFTEAVSEVILDHNVTTLGLGAPGQNHAATTLKILKKLMEAIAEKHGIEVIVLSDGEIIDQKAPQTTDTE
jgi:nucleotide-binding universal stress UspA family protein